MLLCGSDDFFGYGIYSYLKGIGVKIENLNCLDIAYPLSQHQSDTIIFNIISNKYAYSYFIDYLNKNRFRTYKSFVVVMVDNLVSRLCAELLYMEKFIVLTDKSSLHDFAQLAMLASGRWQPRMSHKKILTYKEQKILKLFVDGYSIRDISNLLGRDYKTIHTHRKNIILKLGLSNSFELNRLIAKFNYCSVF